MATSKVKQDYVKDNEWLTLELTMVSINRQGFLMFIVFNPDL